MGSFCFQSARRDELAKPNHCRILRRVNRHWHINAKIIETGNIRDAHGLRFNRQKFRLIFHIGGRQIELIIRPRRHAPFKGEEILPGLLRQMQRPLAPMIGIATLQILAEICAYHRAGFRRRQHIVTRAVAGHQYRQIVNAQAETDRQRRQAAQHKADEQ